MRPNLQPLEDPDQLNQLALEARSLGQHMVERLQQEWWNGSNRFDQDGEFVLIAVQNECIVGVCGLNRDPYCSGNDTGRVRRLYVSAAVRRQGIGRLLVKAIQQRCPGVFTQLQLRTHSPEADAFYRALGFRPVDGDPTCTHAWRVLS
ncbi:Acetyltransferase (GNAT) family protein [Gimesia panareensis]|uniref:Acetyltransferase (GNAT) family protein n=1 Tax=Gimesia panareensis TaxID=2527978 RepID=A0A517Q9V5_9PLAN|nr:GNAT family N-acetyltransferase [Gimesia panareensis]QDT28407.1 Acetyltransferase (GNAT) family protein [Gimesia panareensis]